jgi:hypothetical protein
MKINIGFRQKTKKKNFLKYGFFAGLAIIIVVLATYSSGTLFKGELGAPVVSPSNLQECLDNCKIACNNSCAGVPSGVPRSTCLSGCSNSCGSHCYDLFPSPETATCTDISDLDPDSYLYTAAEFAIEKEYLGPFPEDCSFRPNSVINRAELVRAISIANNWYIVDYEPNTFTDVNPDDWFADYVQTAVERGVISASNDRFRPADRVSRAELIKLIAQTSRYYNNSRDNVVVKASTCPDVSDLENTWFAFYFQFAKDSGIFTDTNCNPGDDATRGDLAQWLYNSARASHPVQPPAEPSPEPSNLQECLDNCKTACNNSCANVPSGVSRNACLNGCNNSCGSHCNDLFPSLPSPEPEPASAPQPSPVIFPDVPSSNSYYDAIMYVYENNIFSGYPDGTFKPNNNIIRAELATVLARGFKIETSPATGNIFTDVPSDEWFSDYVETLVEIGAIDSTFDRFRPGDYVNRAEMIKMFLELTDIPESSPNVIIKSSTCSDVIFDFFRNEWYAKYFQLAVDNGLISSSSCRPGDNATRAEVAQLFYNYSQL